MSNLFLSFLLPVSSCDAPEAWQLYFQEAATPTMEGIINLHNDIMAIITFIAVFVCWMLARTIYLFDASKNKVPSKVVHGTTIELVWTIVPSIILVTIAIPSFALLYSMDEVIDPAITLKVIGHQWYWSYEYSDYNTSEDDTIAFDSYMIADDDLELGQLRLLEVDKPLNLPSNTDIFFIFRSSDVIHSWSVNSFGIKVDPIPGRLNTVGINILENGLFYGQCSEICGINHGFMPIVVKAVEQDEYDQWVSEKKDVAMKLAELTTKEWSTQELVERGEEVYALNCVACHQTNGQGIQGIFPGLVGSEIALNDKERHIEILMEGVQGAAMNSFSYLSEVELAAVITYTRQAWGNAENGDGEIVIPKDIVDYKQPKI